LHLIILNDTLRLEPIPLEERSVGLPDKTQYSKQKKIIPTAVLEPAIPAEILYLSPGDPATGTGVIFS
jgi:hypothetical protein